MEGARTLVVDDVDRLGRDTLDVLLTIEHFAAKGINIYLLSQAAYLLKPNGNIDFQVKMLCVIKALMAESMRLEMLERQRSGIEKARKEGKYKGRPKEGAAQILKRHKDVKKLLLANYSIRVTSMKTGKCLQTVQKVKNFLKAAGEFSDVL